MQGDNAAYPLAGSRKGFCLWEGEPSPHSYLSSSPAERTGALKRGCRPLLARILSEAAAAAAAAEEPRVWESRCVLGWALGWNAGGRSRVHLLPVNRLLAQSICSSTLTLRKGLRASHLTDRDAWSGLNLKPLEVKTF